MTQQNPAQALMMPPPGYGYQGEAVAYQPQMAPAPPPPVQLVQPQTQYHQQAILPTAQQVAWLPTAYPQQPQYPQIQQPGQLDAIGKIVDFLRERDSRQSQPQAQPSPSQDQFSGLGTAMAFSRPAAQFQQEFQQNLSATPTYGVSTPLNTQTAGLVGNQGVVAPPATAPTAGASTDVEKLRLANAQLNQMVTTLLHETKVAKQVIDVLTPFVSQATVLTEFSYGQDKLIEYLKGFVLAEVVFREFSYGQDKLIEFLSDLLSDPQFLLYWAFEIWQQSKPSPEFMELLSSAYLHLSDLNPAPQTTVFGHTVSGNEANAYSRIAASQQVVNQQMREPLRPSVPAPPIPSQNGAQNGWNGVHQNMQSGNVVQAMRQIGKLTPQEWREMFNTNN